MTTRFATRMSVMKPSSIWELLKMTEEPDIISFAGGLPAAELFPVGDIKLAAEREISVHVVKSRLVLDGSLSSTITATSASRRATRVRLPARPD